MCMGAPGQVHRYLLRHGTSPWRDGEDDASLPVDSAPRGPKPMEPGAEARFPKELIKETT